MPTICTSHVPGKNDDYENNNNNNSNNNNMAITVFFPPVATYFKAVVEKRSYEHLL